MRMLFRLMILVLPTLLMGCSHLVPDSFKHRDKTYLYAQNLPPLNIPSGLSSRAFDTLYPVSYRNYPPGSADISLLPPDLLVTNGK